MTAIYLDNAATTPVTEPVLDKTVHFLQNNYGNPSSLHDKGLEAQRAVKLAAAQIASLLCVDPSAILFTNGGTEANNLAILGSLQRHKKNKGHIITSEIEHPSVKEPMQHLENEGFSVSYLPLDKHGNVMVDQLKNLVTNDTRLVSLMHVNNELGNITDIEKAVTDVKSVNKHTLFHVDAVQSFGKIPLSNYASKVDFITGSGHKIHGLKGSAFLYIRPGVNLSPLLLGGGQQKNLRPGTENTPGIFALGAAAEYMEINMDHHFAYVQKLKQIFLDKVLTIPDVEVNGDLLNSSPYILNLYFSGIKGEILFNALNQEGIYVSTGSACNSKREKKDALNHISKEKAGSSIRFGFSFLNTANEIEEVAAVLSRLVPQLRKVTRKR